MLATPLLTYDPTLKGVAQAISSPPSLLNSGWPWVGPYKIGQKDQVDNEAYHREFKRIFML